MYDLTNGKSRIVNTQLYPKAGDKQIESQSPLDVMVSINEYLEGIVEFISANRDKTILEPK